MIIRFLKKSAYIPIFLIPLVLFSCNTRNQSIERFNKVVYQPRYASGFKILGAEGSASTLIAISNPWQGAENISKMLFISRQGEKVPGNFKGEVISGNAERIVCMSSSYIAMLDAIGKVSSVVGVSGINYISNPYISRHRKEIMDIGFDSNINYELLVSLDPDIILLYGLNGANGIEPKLKELGIPFMYIGEYVEESPLGKAEWMVALSELTGARDEGEKVFAAIPERYGQLKEKVKGFKSRKPKVMVNSPYRDIWYMPSTSSYLARLISDAGGEYIYKKNTSTLSATIELEEAALMTAEADVWINLGNVSSIKDLKNKFPKFADIPCVKSGAIYNCDKRLNEMGGNDFWESGVVHPDKILFDLIKIFYPEQFPDLEFTYYRKLE